ncbi:MAG: hypothetical protein ACKPKO_13395 [Candidatus Fonsibacter sp.]
MKHDQTMDNVVVFWLEVLLTTRIGLHFVNNWSTIGLHLVSTRSTCHTDIKCDHFSLFDHILQILLSQCSQVCP